MVLSYSDVRTRARRSSANAVEPRRSRAYPRAEQSPGPPLERENQRLRGQVDGLRIGLEALEAKIARLEADNRRLRRLAGEPVAGDLG
jgi:hypothetical protein